MGGEWKPKMIDNPAYKGEWVHPEIDNPDFKDDAEMYKVCDPCDMVGFELWQVKAGSIFDDIIVTDSVDEAKAAGDKTMEKIEKEIHEAEEKKKREEEDKKREEREAKKKEEDEKKAEEDDEDDDEEEEEAPKKDEL